MMKCKSLWFLLPVISFFSGIASASVVMTGTRVIFPSSVMEKTIRLKNPDAQPYVVQLEMTDESGKVDKNPLFSPVPPVFRMEPNSGQSVRLIFAGKGLPEDKESLFYMDFTQLPSLKKTQQEQNQLIIAVRNRVKVFYRPESLKGTQSDAYKALVFGVANGHLNIENPTGFYIPIRSAQLLRNSQHINLADNVMISPKSESQWPLPKTIRELSGSRLEMIFVNDYGVDVKTEKTL